MFQRLFKKEKLVRVDPDRSTCELMDTSRRLRTELRAALYLYNEEKFIVCAIAGIAESGEPVILDVTASDESLGLALCDALLEFKPKGERDLSRLTVNDWAAYKRSGAKSAKAFEQKSYFVYVKTEKMAIQIEAVPRIPNTWSLRALCSISNGNSHSEIGAAIRQAITAARVLRDAGMF